MGIEILFLGLIIFIAYLFTIIFERTKIPDILLLMIFGVLIGPKIFNFADTHILGKFGDILTRIALIVILFEGGTKLNVKFLKNYWDETTLLTLPTFILTAALVGIVTHYLFDLNFMQSAIAGGILGGTSSAVVVPIIKSVKIGRLSYIVLFLESAITDVLAIIITFSLIDAFKTGHIDTGLIIGKILANLIVASLFGILGAYLWSGLIQKMRAFPTNLFSTIAFIFVIYGLTELLGFNGAISSLAFGITLSNLTKLPEDIQENISFSLFAKLTNTEKVFFSELVFLLKIFFFVFLGISINFGEINTIYYGFLTTLALFLLRALIVKYIMPKKINKRDAIYLSILIPKGLAAAVLAVIPFNLGIIQDIRVTNFIYSIIFFSILISAILVAFTGKNNIVKHLFLAYFKNFKNINEELLTEVAGEKKKEIKKKL
ncbi:cation:proton antiporter [bacterium]|nr:cation:proton antiporter [bacterium]